MARKKTLFDDRPVEIAELTFIIKQDLASLNSQLSSLGDLSKSHKSQAKSAGAKQESEHKENVSSKSQQLRVMVINQPLGRSAPAKKPSQRWFQLSRSPRGPHEKHPGISLSNGKFCLLGLTTCPTRFRLTTVRLTPVQYTD